VFVGTDIVVGIALVTGGGTGLVVEDNRLVAVGIGWVVHIVVVGTADIVEIVEDMDEIEVDMVEWWVGIVVDCKCLLKIDELAGLVVGAWVSIFASLAFVEVWFP
jgi:hypothetical protein